MRPLSIEAGYRYLNLAGKDGNRDNAIADGPYVGVNASFDANGAAIVAPYSSFSRHSSFHVLFLFAL